MENKEVQKQLNGLVIESGNANAEVLQARGSDTTLNSRLSNPNYTPIKDEVNRQVISKSTTKRPMVTFIDDDGRLEVLQKWEPILQEKANKLTVALVSSWIENKDTNTMSWEDVHRLKTNMTLSLLITLMSINTLNK